MDIRPTSTTRTHHGKRLVRALVTTGTVATVVALAVLSATTPATGSGSSQTAVVDGKTMTLMTEAPQSGVQVDQNLWRASVLANPNLLGDTAPVAMAQVSDSRSYSLQADKEAAIKDGTASDSAAAEPTATASAAGFLTDEEKQAIADASTDVTPIAQQVAVAWVTYSGADGGEKWASGVSSAAKKAGSSLTDALTASVQAAADSWGTLAAQKVVAVGQSYGGRAPSVWVADDLSQARVVVAVQRTASSANAAERVDYPLVTVTLTPTGTDGAWQVAAVSTN